MVVTILILAMFAILFPMIFMGVTWLISKISGWSRLASLYRTDAPPSGNILSMQSGKIGFAQYNNVLTVSILETGIRLSVLLPFRFGHPPILIPWEDISDVKEARFGFRNCISMAVGSPTITVLRLPATISEHLPS